ncbi:MAG: serine O-acetyltransferase [Flavisolibacter sp.]
MNETSFIQALYKRNREQFAGFPDQQLARNLADDLFGFLFGSCPSGKDGVDSLVGRYGKLKRDLSLLLAELKGENILPGKQAQVFFENLPLIYKKLWLDAEALLTFDPAASSIEEVLLAYPGFYATAIHRFAHQLHLQGVSTLPRLLSEFAHSRTGIDIHPAARIGSSFAIDHGTGIVIGETSHIGDHVKIYQGVTLGALNVSKANAALKRHPTIENGVVIYAGATILGGETVIGAGSIIGGNVWLTRSVPSNSVVYHKSEIRIKDKTPFPEPLNFMI